MSDYREHWLLQYILTRSDFVHHKTSQRGSHKHLRFQYNYSIFCLCSLETKLHQRLPVEKNLTILCNMIKYAYYVRFLNLYIFLPLYYTRKKLTVYECRVWHTENLNHSKKYFLLTLDWVRHIFGHTGAGHYIEDGLQTQNVFKREAGTSAD